MPNLSVIFFKKIFLTTLIVSILVGSLHLGIKQFAFITEPLLVSLVCSGWLFYPVYLFLAQYNRKAYNHSLQEKYTHIVENFLLKSSESYNENIDTKWLKILEVTFSPVSVKKVHDPNTKEKIINLGDNLYVSLLSEVEYKYCIAQAEQGKRKFIEQDIETVKFLKQLLTLNDDIINSQKDLLFNQRKQLAKDIHDDLSGRLLSILKNSTQKQRPLVMEALTDLRNILNQLDINEASLQEVFGDIRLEMKSRIAFYKTEFIWKIDIADMSDIKVNSQVYSNLRRIFREATTNALKYMKNRCIETSVYIDKQGFLSISITNFGTYIEDTTGSGKGLSNMVIRADLINGHVNWHRKADSFSVQLLINLDTTNQPNDT